MSGSLEGKRFKSLLTAREYVVVCADDLEPWKWILQDEDRNLIGVSDTSLRNPARFIALSTSGEVKP